MTSVLPNGMGQYAADRLASRGPVYTSHSVWYVNSTVGVDAASPRGLTEEYPLATLGQAVTNAAAFGNGTAAVIVLMAGHTETITAPVSIGYHIYILGGGTSAGKPSARLINGVSGGAMLDLVDTSYVRLRNVWFPEPVVSATQPTVLADGILHVERCYFECGANNDTGGYTLFLNGTRHRIDGCTLVSVATTKTDRPTLGIYATGANTAFAMWRDLTLDGGVHGWDTYALEIQEPSLGFYDTYSIETLSLLRGSDVLLASGMEGLVQMGTVTGGSRVNW